MGTSAYSRLAVIGALAAALALGACGRKGPLEAPPSANAVAATPQPAGPSLGEGDPQGFEAQRDDMPAPQASKKTFILDPLLGNDRPRRTPPPQTSR